MILSDPAVAPAASGCWTMSDKAAQRRSPLRYAKREQSIVTWKVRITGDSHDLHELQQSFAGSSISIESGRNHEHYLLADSFQECTNENEVKKAASKLIALIGGASRLALGGNIPITQSETVKVNANGSESIFMDYQDTAHARDAFHISAIDGEGNVIEEIKPADDVPTWVSLGMDDEAVAKALRLLAEPLDWVALYRIYEVIESDMGGLDALVSRGWATKARVKLFKHTSNSPGAVGDNARHGKESSQPPSQPMRLHEARNLVESLINLWLKGKNSH